MRHELEKQANRLHLLIHQLQDSVVRSCETSTLPYEDVVEHHARLLKDELEKVEGGYAMPLMMVFLMEGVRV